MIRPALLWLVLALPIAAQDLPAPQYTSVNDFAHVLTNDDSRIIDQALIALHDETGIEGTVVTMDSRAEYGGTDGLEPFASRLFNHWGVGDKTRNDGFMVLLLKGDRETRIELGAGYPRSFDQVAASIISGTMAPAFREGDYSGGLRDGTQAVIARIARVHAAAGAEPAQTVTPPSPAPPPLASAEEPAERSAASRVFSGLITGFFLLIGGLFGWDRLSKFLGRNRCPQCGARDLITIEGPVRDDHGDGSWTFSEMSVRRNCPACGWSEERRTKQPQSITYGPGGVILGTINHVDHDRSRFHEDRGSRSDRDSGGGGGFGGGSSSGGGASGRF